MSRAEQQASFLENRQKQFKVAALEAKKNGDIELAKQYIRMAKVRSMGYCKKDVTPVR